MFDGFRRIIGAIQVKQTADSIIVNGIPADVMARDISRIWGTSKINLNMFTVVTKNSFAFPLFFAPDIVYAIDVIMKDRYKRVSLRVLHCLKEKLMEETWLKQTTIEAPGRLDFSRLADMVLEPLPYQMEFLQTYDKIPNQYNLNGYLLAAAPGSGKTNMSLTWAQMLQADMVVVVGQMNSMERVWAPSIETLFKKEQTYWMAHRGLMVKGNERFIVGHYEAMQQVEDAMVLRMHQLGPSAKIVIILDESHNVNEINNLRTPAFLKLVATSRSNNILWMSGTPIKALGSESIPLFRAIDPLFTPDVEARFKKIFGKEAKKGLDILSHRLGIVSFKIEKERLGLLPPIFVPVKVPSPNGHLYTLRAVVDDMRRYVDERRAFYKKTEKDDTAKFYSMLDDFEKTLTSSAQKKDYAQYRNYLAMVIKAYLNADLASVKDESLWVNRYEKNVIRASLVREDKELFRHLKTIVKYVGLKIQGECLGRVLGRKRIECHVDLTKHIDFTTLCDTTEKKTLVFTSFVEVLQEASLHCKQQGLTPLVVYGETNHDLSSILKRFETDPDINPLIATYNSLSTAVPLVMADNVILINSPFRAYIYEQAISRVHRLGSDSQVYVRSVTLDTGDEPNLSTRTEDILAWSQSQVEKIMGIKSPFEVTDTMSLESIALEGVELDNFQFPAFKVTVASEEFDISLEEIIEVGNSTKAPSFAKW